jgi:hypothetical protein
LTIWSADACIIRMAIIVMIMVRCRWFRIEGIQPNLIATTRWRREHHPARGGIGVARTSGPRQCQRENTGCSEHQYLTACCSLRNGSEGRK